MYYKYKYNAGIGKGFKMQKANVMGEKKKQSPYTTFYL